MNKFRIVTDSNSDMAPGFAEEHGILELELTYLMEEKSYRCNDPALSRAEFYQKMRDGQMPKTAAVNVEDVTATLTPALEAGSDLLCIMFSSNLSATCSSTQIAAKELAERFPERKIAVVDTLCASAGESLLVSQAVKYQKAGLSLEETEKRIREDAPHIAHLITVNDLFHLHRGGRVSATAAVVGSVLGIKPTIRVDEEGRLLPTGKVRGRRQSLISLVDGMEKQMDRERCDCYAITHGDCAEDAAFVVEEIRKRLGIEEHTISYVGPTIGAHSGPGTIALCFYAKFR